MKRGPLKRKQGPNDSNLGGPKIWKSPYKVNNCFSGTKFCYWAPAKYKSGPTKLKGSLENGVRKFEKGLEKLRGAPNS